MYWITCFVLGRRGNVWQQKLADQQKGPIWPLFFAEVLVAYLEGVSDALAKEVVDAESCAGPRPSLIMARESGTSLVCQPLSLWNFCMAASVPESQWPEGSPVR